MVLLLLGAAVVISRAKASTVEGIGAGSGSVKRWGGYVLVLVGLWLTASGIWADAFARLFPV